MTEPRPIDDAAEQGRARIDDDIVLDDRVARVVLSQHASLFVDLEPLRAERHGLVDAHILADLGGLADHHAGAVVDENRSADPAPG